MFQIIRCVVIAVVLASVIPSVLWADPAPAVITPDPSGNTLSSEATLPEVVVTADRLDMPASQVANSMSVLTAKDIEQKQAATAYDALQGLPGLNLTENGGKGENSGIFIRGADAGHTLVLMNGVPINNPITTDRQFGYLDQLFADDIDRIEVVRNPLSTLYGTNASAGVVNIITQKGEGSPKGSLFFEGGAYQSFREGASVSGGGSLGDFHLDVTRFDSQGFPSADKAMGNVVNSVDGNTTASLQMGLLPSANLDNNLYVRYSQAHTNLPAAGGEGGDDPNFFLDERQWFVGTHSKWNVMADLWEQELGISFSDDLQYFTDDISSYALSHYERGAYEGQAAQVNLQNNIHPWAGETLVAGIQGQQEWGRVDDTTDYGYGLSESLVNGTATTGSYFLESQTELMDRLFITLGGRMDAVSSFGDQFTYRGAMAYFIPGTGTKLKASFGTGFKAPSLYQLDSIYGNQALSPENSTGWDVGFEQPIWKELVRFGATYFHTDFLNLIDFESISNFPYGEYFNISKAETLGWETFASSKPIKGLELHADYTYTWAVDLDNGSQLLRRPQDKADFGATYAWNSASFGMNVVYIGERPDAAFDNFTYVTTPVTLSAYTLVNLLASYQMDEHVKFFGRVENLFNTQYEQIFGYGTPGQSVYLGTKVSL